MTEIKIRRYTNGDRETLIILMDEFSEYIERIDPLHRVKYVNQSSHTAVDRMVSDATEKDGIVLVAEYEGNVIGFIEGHTVEQAEEDILSVGERKVGRIQELFVTSKYRSRNIGSLLMEQIEAYFRENGVESIFIEVFAPNTNARHFYENKGYQERDIDLIKVIKT